MSNTNNIPTKHIFDRTSNYYCDESCHLLNDGFSIMVLGATGCRVVNKNKIYNEIREIKKKHGMDPYFEIKWNKVSPAKVDLYLDLIDYFFCNNNIHFRAVLIKNKLKLNHSLFNHNDHNEWYYKMYYQLLSRIIMWNPNVERNFYLDIKDTQGGYRISKLNEFLKIKFSRYSPSPIKSISQIRSNNSELLQLTDLLIGAISYYHRYSLNNMSSAKKEIILKIINDYYINLNSGTRPNESSFNLFIWTPSEVTPLT